MFQPTLYKHSGKAPVGGMLLTLVGGLIAGLVLSVIYSFLIFWIPFVYINFFVTFGFGLLIGVAVGSIAKFGKIRNTGVVAMLALGVAIIAYYAHWVAWIEFAADTRITEPGALWQFLSTLATLGAWSIFGWTPTGFAMWAIWGVEAVMIVGLGTFSAMGIIDIPFCEDTGQWAKDEKLAVRFKTVGDAASPESPMSLLGTLQPMAEASAAYAEVTIATADGSELRCVSLDNVVVNTDKEGKESSTKTSVVRHMLFDRDSFERLLSLSKTAAA